MSSKLLLLLLVPLLTAQSPAHQKSVSLRGLISLSEGIIWTSGTAGTILRSLDDGRSWQTCPSPTDAATLDFRGVYAWNARHALAMSAGTGPLSRLYETTDGCHSWRLRFTNPDPDGFWDALAFSPIYPAQGVLLGDPVQGRFTIYRTIDGGRHWVRDTSPALASNPAGEGAFAASNSAVAILPGTLDLVFGTGGAGGPRIFRCTAKQKVWSSVALPVIAKKESAGVFSIFFRSATDGVAVGGDYKQPQSPADTAFITRDGGRTWTASSVPPGGYRSAVAWDKVNQLWVAAGPTGLDVATNEGDTWKPSGQNEGSWNALSPPWAVGSTGHPIRFDLSKR